LDRELGARVFFKCENQQKVGAFKCRGAVNAVLSLSDEEASRGIGGHSSGNHAAALAYAAAIRGIPCTVVMPETAMAIKVDAVRGYGAEIVFCPEGERASTAKRVIEDKGAIFIHPFQDPRVIAGQGTAALELVEDVPDLDMVAVPVGGGGLAAGTCIAVHGLRPSAQILAAEPLAVDDAHRSMATGVLQPRVEKPQTLADGLLTGIGELNFQVFQEHGLRVITVTEEQIVEAARFHLQRMKILVEPSGATVLAALRSLGSKLQGKRIGAILSGGNTDLSWWEN
jgi:threonine dehydratase